eukprot:scaffold3017_cov229-Prasinococcus_capsulatus_cf.AAC.2
MTSDEGGDQMHRVYSIMGRAEGNSDNVKSRYTPQPEIRIQRINSKSIKTRRRQYASRVCA